MIKDYILLQKCIEIIVLQLDWGQPEDWQFKHFELLSDKMFEITGTRINARTLRRLFGQEKSKKTYNPQLDTKNALAKLAGYKNWLDFTDKHSSEENDSPIRTKKNNKRKFTFISIAILFIGTCMLAFFVLKNESSKIPNFTFKADVVEGPSPLNVKFKYDISEFDEDVYINFGVFKKSLLLDKNDSVVLFSYKSPGVMRARLIYKEKEIATQRILAYSDSWIGQMIDNTNYYPIKLDQTDDLKVDEDNLKKIANVLNMSEFWVKYINYRNFNISIDSMTFSTRMRCYESEPNPCPDLMIRLQGEYSLSENNNSIQAHFVPEGCQHFIHLKVDNRIIEGLDTDLNLFQQEITTWKTYTIKTKNKVASFYCDSVLVDTFHYNNTLGELHGIQLKLKYGGSVDFVKIESPDSVIYLKDF